ncbi:MAG: TonB-dependent receptor [Acidobacteria bacterium]|nr:TonB-dependent receptor [Acidobacteriota bacterium]
MSRSLFLCLLAALPLCAQQAAPPPVRESIVVTGTWEPLPLEEADRTVLSLPAAPQRLLLNNLPDLLQLDPSLDLRQRAPNGLQGDLSIRGATFGQTLVLLNGRRMNDPQSGHHSLDIPVPLETVQSVEVLRGAGSTLYGSDALGGVVNVITSTPESWQARLRLAAGSFGAQQQSAFLSGSHKGVTQLLSFSRDYSTGFIPNRDYRNLSLSSATHFRHTSVDLAYADKPFGAQNFYGAYPSWERTKTWFAGLRQGLGQRTDFALSYRRHTDLFYLYRDNPQRYQNHHSADGFHASLRRRDPLRQNFTLFTGAELFTDRIESSNLGVHSRARGAAYTALDVRALNRFSFNAGLRTESYRGAFDQISPSLSAAYWAASKLKIRAAASRAYRLPTFTELYYKDPANQGNSALQSESAWSYETGADYRPHHAWRLQATLFHRQDRNGIDYMSRSPQGPWQAANITRLNFTGLESSASLRYRAQVLDWSYTALHAASTLPSGIYTKYAFNYPIHSGVFSWTGNLPRHFTARTRIGALERRGRSPYAIWDVYAAWRGSRLRPFVQFTNLANTRYEEILSVPMPGRAVLGGIEWSLR